MPWEPLESFRDATVPKLYNLRLAARAGLTVPATVWAWAAELHASPAVAACGSSFPCIVRSGSPTEDTVTTSNAGQLLSLVVDVPGAFAAAVQRVVAALPERNGQPLGAVFVQPLVEADVAGVTFFDGFYFEETRAPESNVALTAGLARGAVRRGHVQRGVAHHEWLLRVHRLLGRPVDLEWAQRSGQEASEPVLLQVRPALFPIRRCETLSLANHKEILGDPPSPWMVGLLAEVSRPVMRFFERIDPRIAGWAEPYAIELGERAWLNFSAFFRLMDHWGLPRTMVTDGVGGESGGAADAQPIPGRLLRALPTFVRLFFACLRTAAAVPRGLRSLTAQLAEARTLADIQRVNVRALEFSIRTNFAIMTLLSGLTRLRRAVGIERTAEVITQRMMADYAALAARPAREDRLCGLDDWLARYGHRGPLESDPCQPRFSELRDLLAHDLERGAAPVPAPRPTVARWVTVVLYPLFWVAELRERFRDHLMRWWQTLRTRILGEARRAVEQGWLTEVDDVFWLRSEDLTANPACWRDRVVARRQSVADVAGIDLPATAPRDAIEVMLARGGAAGESAVADRFHGIGLGQTRVVGTAVRAAALTTLLDGVALPATPVLVVATLEPSWAVVFPRFAAVVAELGGELSHASILLREAGIPAVVNAQGAYRSIADGDLIRVDPASGEVRVERAVHT